MSVYDLKFSILMPVYNVGGVIDEALKSILSQDFDNYEIIMCNDGSTDTTVQVIKSIQDPRIKLYENEKNLGYSTTLEKCRTLATGDIIYLMGGDDILGKTALIDTYNAFKISEDIGAVTRPYFWFESSLSKPIRAKKQLNPNKDEVVRINDDFHRVRRVFETLDQLSGLAYRVEYMDLPFHEDCFPSHIYPFASIFKRHPVVFLKDYNLAVRIGYSQTRKISSIYERSPMASWVGMVNSVFKEDEFRAVRQRLIEDFIARNYVGLVQLRNFARYRYLLREIWYLIKYRWQNIFRPAFWFFSLGCILTPPALLIPMVDWYKENVLSKNLQDIDFEYSLEA